MTDKDKLNLLELRYRRLLANGKNFKNPGVSRKLSRQIRNLNERKNSASN